MGRWLRMALLLGIMSAVVALGCGGQTDKGQDGKGQDGKAQDAKGQNGKAQNGADRFFLWKVTSQTNTVYLLGSMHVGKKDYYPLPATIEDAFTQCKTLVVELDPDKLDQAAVANLVKAQGMYPPGQSLSKSVAKKTRDLLKSYCAGKGIKMEAFESLRPWTVLVALMAQEIQTTGFSGEFGHDKHFLAKAKKAGTPVIELETADMQIRLFSGLSPELQEAALAKSLGDMGQMKETMDKIWSAWQAGDANAMDTLMLAGYRQSEFRLLMERTFDQRNVKMADKIEGFLKDKEPHFVIVGAGHVVGDKGIVKILQDKKYQVEQVRRQKVKKAA